MKIDDNVCIECGHEFNDKNVYSEAGWRETKISGMCEVCFDELFTEDDIDELDNHAFVDEFGDAACQ